jgi:diacylglycerol kinase (ATP)
MSATAIGNLTLKGSGHNMKKAQLLHNPTAGEKDFSGEELIKLIEKEGYECKQASVKELGWDEFESETDFLICAGGDGTIRRIVKALMKRKRLDKQFPIAVLPHGTANNVAGTLGINGSVEDIVKSWHNWTLKKFDIGKVYGLKDDLFFLEGFGCGIFPRLMKAMERMGDEQGSSREERIKFARVALHEIVLKYEPVFCKIVADEVEHSGKYIMVEVMNTKAIGPNLELAPHGDPGDGEFDVVLIPESHQKKFEKFLLDRIEGGEGDFSFTIIKAKKLELTWNGKDVHADDERLKPDRELDVKIEILPGMIDFLV